MIDTLINKLRTLDVKMDIINDRLDIQAAKGVIDTSLIEEIKLHKDALIDFVKVHKSDNGAYFDIKSIDKQEHYPLSSAQRRLWILSQFEDQSIAYNMPSQTVLTGGCDIQNFEKAINSVIKRHEILRTVFKEEKSGEVRQMILPIEAFDFSINHEDFSEFSDKELRIQQYIDRDTKTAFDLENGPLLRVAILKASEDTFVFYYNMHHIISDGWSMKVLTNDVLDYYEGYCLNTVPQLAPLRIQYKEYTAWQQEQLESQASKKHSEYWLNQFSTEIPLLDLPSQKKRPLIKTSNGWSLETIISKELTSDLKKFCKEKEGSLFIGLLAIMNTLFSKYTSQNDFVIGSPTAGRDHIELENQIGFYVNTIALRNEVSQEESFEELFDKIKDNTFKAYEHQQYPFDRLVEDLNLKRDNSRNPIFDVMVILQNIVTIEGGKEINIENLDAIIDHKETVSKYDLCFTFEEIGEYLSVEVTFNTDIYVKETIEQFLTHFKCILTDILKYPKEKIRNLNYLSDSEEKELLITFNETKVAFPTEKSIIELFEDQVNETPNAIAIINGGKDLTYKDLNDLSDRYASYLYDVLDVKNDDKVIVSLSHNYQLMAVLLAVKKNGAIYVPVDPKTPSERIQYIEKDSKSVAVINQATLTQMDSYEFTSTNINLSKKSNIEFIIYTSGSSGMPKGVLLKSSSVNNRLHWMWKNYPFQEDEVCCAKTSIGFVDHIWEFYGPLLKGIPLVFYKKEEILSIQKFVDSLHKDKVSRIVLVPSLLRELIKHPELCREKLQNLHLWISSGEALKKSDVEKFYNSLRSSNVRLLNIYGSTEVTADATYYDTYNEYNKFKKFNLFDCSIKNEIEQLITTHDNSNRIISDPFDSLVKQEHFKNVDFNSQLNVEEYITFLKSDLLPNVVNVGVPSYVGHMTSLIPDIFRELNSLVTILNQNQVKIETSMISTLVEKQVIGIFHNLIYKNEEAFYKKYVQAPDDALGVITNGGTMSNIMALNYTLNNLLKATDGFDGISKEGLIKALDFYGYQDVVLLGSRWCHYSFGKALKLLGLGTKSFVELDYENKDTATIREEISTLIKTLRDNKTLVLGIVGIGGTTESGNIDPLVTIGEIAKEHNIHYHVDAAFGGSFMMDDEIAKKLDGIQLANSVSVCAHKQLYIPIGLSICLFKDPSFVESSENNTHYQARKGSYDLGKYTVEGSRNFMCLLLHAAFKIFGKNGFAQVIRYNYNTAQEFARLINEDPSFRLLYKPDLNIVLYRYIPVKYRNTETFTDSELEVINELNRKIQQEQFKRGNTFVSYTQIKKTENTIRNLVFRTVFMNPYTTIEDLKIMLEEQKGIAASLESINYSSNIVTTSDNILIGKPIENVKVYILDNYLNILPVGVIGEICISGECVSAGYVNENEGIANKFIESPFVKGEKLYKTGDLGRRWTDGNIECVGRKDDMVKIFGNRVELGEVEYQLQSYKDIKESVVLAKELETGETKIIAYVVADEKQDVASIRGYLLKRLPTYMIPSYFIQLDEIPLTSNGKVNKTALSKIDITETDNGIEFIVPRNDLEKEIVSLCEKVLQRERVSLKDNFYDIGGDSIKLIQLLFELKSIGFDIKAEHLLTATDIEAITILLANIQRELTTNKTLNSCEYHSLLGKKWKVGDKVQISENQRYMMRYKDSQAILGPFTIPSSTKEELDNHFRGFLGHFPELHLQFTNEGDKIYQEYLTLDKLPLHIDYEKLDLSNEILVKEYINKVSEREYEFFEGELIRLFVIKDSKNIQEDLLVVAISHALADLHTDLVFNQALEQFINEGAVSRRGKNISNFHYSSWQHEYLASIQGVKSRDFWLDYLGDIPVLDIQKSKKPQINNGVKQTLLIATSEAKDIERLSKKLRVPIACLFMAYHQVLLQECSSNKASMQFVLVNGRESFTDVIDTASVLGVVNNVIPIKLVQNTSADLCSTVQLEYLNARQHQSIPYEIIRKDVLIRTTIDIDSYEKGFINIKQMDGVFRESEFQNFSIVDCKLKRDLYLDLSCVIKKNGIQLELMCDKKIYDKYKKSLLKVKDFIPNMIRQLSH
ncbi:condensation domain-containing protein [Dokdonia ponticola]|uniref:Condensation domain-containing protein n=1 Tax=Dokdonia ponticola TaxID=2041041 RepID=A0ABV9HYR4_9FLAO